MFYRAGYIEAWGRGIQKIYESCNEFGSPVPEYKKLGDDLTVKFVAAKVEHSQSSKNPKHQNEALDEALEDRIIAEIKNDPSVKQDDLLKKLNVSRASVQRSMKNLQTSGRIQRVGGKRFGYWEIL
ncbi:MAG: HTH domain-containing protein [Oscillospiraceae bacterium]|nr:HTH domain-containing protein [Oscillospiraceae bacterium]